MRWRSNTLEYEARQFALRVEAALLVVCAHGLVRLFLPRVMPWAMRTRAAGDTLPPPELERDLRLAIANAARVLPWQPVCLPDAIAAKMMLARRGYRSTIHLGVGWKDDGAMHAHAWLEAGREPITGGGQRHTVTPIPR